MNWRWSNNGSRRARWRNNFIKILIRGGKGLKDDLRESPPPQVTLPCRYSGGASWGSLRPTSVLSPQRACPARFKLWLDLHSAGCWVTWNVQGTRSQFGSSAGGSTYCSSCSLDPGSGFSPGPHQAGEDRRTPVRQRFYAASDLRCNRQVLLRCHPEYKTYVLICQ